VADITNVQAIKFSNEQGRPFADRFARLYYDAKLFVDQWNAQNLSAVIPNVAGDLVVDGSRTDGRREVSGADLYGVLNRAIEIVTDFEATSSAKLNTILAVAVNPGP